MEEKTRESEDTKRPSEMALSLSPVVSWKRDAVEKLAFFEGDTVGKNMPVSPLHFGHPAWTINAYNLIL